MPPPAPPSPTPGRSSAAATTTGRSSTAAPISSSSSAPIVGGAALASFGLVGLTRSSSTSSSSSGSPIFVDVHGVDTSPSPSWGARSSVMPFFFQRLAKVGFHLKVRDGVLALVALFLLWRLIVDPVDVFAFLTMWCMALLLFLLLHQRLSENQRRQEALCLTSFTLQWLVSAIFWLAVFPELEGPIGLAQRIVLTFEHSFPLAVHIFESFNGSLALQPRDAGYPILFVLVYVLWMLFYHTVFGWAWPYPFMPQLVASPLTFAVSVLGLVLTVASCAGWTLLFHFYIIREVRRLLLGNAHSGTESLLLGD